MCAQVDDSVNAQVVKGKTSAKLTSFQERNIIKLIMDLEQKSAQLEQGLMEIIQKAGDNLRSKQSRDQLDNQRLEK